jgi:hypothetical protein
LDCDFPRWGQYLLSGYMLFMLVLFSNFYIHEYYLRAKKRKEHQNGISNGNAAHSNGKKRV